MADLMEQAEFGVVSGTHTPISGAARPDAGQAAPPADLSLFPEISGGETARRGAGRPPGSANMRTREYVRLARELSGGRDPLVGMYQAAVMPVEELGRKVKELSKTLAIDVGFTVEGLLKFQLQAQIEATKYVHARRVPVDENGDDVLPVMMVGTLARQVEGRVNGDTMNLYDAIEMNDFNELSDAECATESEGSRKDD